MNFLFRGKHSTRRARSTKYGMRGMLNILFAVVFVLCLIPMGGGNALDVSVSNITDLKTYLLDKNVTKITLSSQITISSGTHTLASVNQGVTIVGRLRVNGGTLIIGNDSSEILIIDGNGASGSVITLSSGTLTMNGGTIRGGRASSGGGGVYMGGGTFNMNGGKITSNTATGQNGGGVYVEGGTFNMYGGTISYNTATTGKDSDGGGVSVAPGGTANIFAGYFYGNRCNLNGGAIGTGWPTSGKNSVTRVYNPVIVGNQAKTGGGLYGCPEGTVANIENYRTAIFGNNTTGSSSESKASKDVQIDEPTGVKVPGNNKIVVPAYMLNSIPYQWSNSSDIGKTLTKFSGTNNYTISGLSTAYNASRSESDTLAIIKRLEAEFPDGRVFIVNNSAGDSGGGVGGDGSWVVLGADKPVTPSNKGILTLKKIVSGGNASDLEEVFEFTVTIGGVVTTVFLKHGESRTFTDITVGTAFSITEKSNPNYTLGWSLDGSTVTGTTVSGTITTSESVVAATATNTRLGNLTLTKMVSSPPGLRSNFNFTVTFSNAVTYHGADRSAAGTTFTTGPINILKDQTHYFSGIPMGTTYTIVETNYTSEGYIYPPTNQGDPMNGIINNAKPDADVIVENKWTALPTASVIIKGTKAVTGTGVPSTTFTFSLTQLNTESVTDVKSSGITRTATQTMDGEFSFPVIEGLSVGTYYFRVQETSGGSGMYWSNDTSARVVTVTVSGSPPSAVYSYSTGSSTFTNTYTTPSATSTSLIIEGTKAYSNSSAPADVEFTFELVQLNDSTPSNEKDGGVRLTAERSGAGNFQFAAITGLEADTIYYFKITETAANPSLGWTLDSTPRVVTVTVNGVPTASYSYDAPGSGTFTNGYTEPSIDNTSIIIGGDKKITGDEAPSASFHFSLVELNSSSLTDEKSGGVTRSAIRSGGAGPFNFLPAIVYTAPGTYYYRITELQTGLGAGWAIDARQRLVTVVVKLDSENSSYYVDSVVYSIPGETATSAQSAEFTNKYTPPTEETPPPEEKPTSTPPPPPPPPPTETPTETPSETPPSESPTVSPSVTPPPPSETPYETDEPYYPDDEPYDDGPFDSGDYEPDDGIPLDMPPIPLAPGNTLVQDGDVFIEFDEDGVPLGEWHWDEDEELWVFDPYPVPLGEMEYDIEPALELPQTSGPGLGWQMLLLMGILLAGSGAILNFMGMISQRRWERLIRRIRL